MGQGQTGFKLSRRLLLGASVLGGAVLWGGATLARLARDPSGEKNAGRIADIDGVALPLKPLESAPAHDPSLPWLSKGGEINDASALSRTPVYGVVAVTEDDHVARALAFARDNGLKVSIAAVRHSMGGQAFDDDGAGARHARAQRDRRWTRGAHHDGRQPGATWHDIQNALHPRFAVKAMQSTDIFTVGGSISVNAHGMDHHAGSVVGSVRSMRVMLADGSVVTASREENAELFRHVVGGYGLFGMVLSAVLDMVETTSTLVARADPGAGFPGVLRGRIAADPKIGLTYRHLSTAPGIAARGGLVYSYRRRRPIAGSSGRLWARSRRRGRERLFVNLAKRGRWPASLKWWAEKNLEHRFETCTVTRAQAMGDGEACLVTRNDPMHDSVAYLRNNLARRDRHPPRIFRAARADRAVHRRPPRDHVRAQDVDLVNASIRAVEAEHNALTYAPAPAFSVVLYINQTTDADGNGTDGAADQRPDRPHPPPWRPLLPALSAPLHRQAASGLLSGAAGVPGEEAGLRSGRVVFFDVLSGDQRARSSHRLVIIHMLQPCAGGRQASAARCEPPHRDVSPVRRTTGSPGS